MGSQGEGSVTRWIGDLKSGGDSAAQRLWERYFERLVRLARNKLQTTRRPRTVEDEEDAALSAFDSFCRGVDRGRFPRLADRDDLWRLLVVLTMRKALDQIERQGAARRSAKRGRSSDRGR
jgi:ECF sigma factor